MEIALAVTAGVTDREKLLNGTETITFAGESEDGWSVNGSISWNLGLIDFAGEGDLVASAPDDSEIFATLTRADVRAGAEEGADLLISFEYDVDGGSGRFADAAGSARGEATLAADTLRGSWVLALTEG